MLSISQVKPTDQDGKRWWAVSFKMCIFVCETGGGGGAAVFMDLWVCVVKLVI